MSDILCPQCEGTSQKELKKGVLICIKCGYKFFEEEGEMREDEASIRM